MSLVAFVSQELFQGEPVLLGHLGELLLDFRLYLGPLLLKDAIEVASEFHQLGVGHGTKFGSGHDQFSS